MAENYFGILKDADGNICYPTTFTSQVIASDGNSIDNTLQSINNKLDTLISKVSSIENEITYLKNTGLQPFRYIRDLGNEDLNNLSTAGMYKIPSNVIAATVSNKPSGVTNAGMVIVMNVLTKQETINGKYQYFLQYYLDFFGNTWFRYVTSDNYPTIDFSA